VVAIAKQSMSKCQDSLIVKTRGDDNHANVRKGCARRPQGLGGVNLADDGNARLSVRASPLQNREADLLLKFGMVADVAVMLGWIVAIVLMFQHKREFPKLYIGLAITAFSSPSLWRISARIWAWPQSRVWSPLFGRWQISRFGERTC
jgi:hypothetical protein